MPHSQRLDALREAIQPHRQALLDHRLYQAIDQVAALRAFMEHHVFAVWDFMSLLKRLQTDLTSSAAPWLPPANPQAARFVNEIVLGEETDERPDGGAGGGYASHYDLYLTAMNACGADTAAVERLLELVGGGSPVREALAQLGDDGSIEPSVVAFVGATFDLVDHGATHEVASAFTFGREDLLPDVFRQIVAGLNREEGGLDDFEYYLGRHIELDEDHHGPMAERLVTSLCGDSDQRWQEATEAAVATLQARLALWDAIASQIAAPQPV